MLDLQSLVNELDRQMKTKTDVVVDARQLRVEARDGGFYLLPDHAQAEEWIPRGGCRINRHALAQVCERGEPSFPFKFANELLGANFGDKAADLMTDLLRTKPQRNMVRMLDGNVRAFLSNKYMVMDNHDLAFAALGVVRNCGGEVISCSLTDTRMRIQFTSRTVWEAVDTMVQARTVGALSNHEWLTRVDRGRMQGFDMPGGPGTIRPLVTLSNSETGHGGYNVSLGILQDVCINGAIIERVSQRVHLGAAMAEGVFRPETVQASSKAVMMQAEDAIRAAFDPAGFRRLVEKIEGAQAEEVKAPSAAVNMVVKNFELPVERKEAILEYFLRDYGGADAYGLAQAVSRVAQDVDDADEAEAFQDAAGQIIAKPVMVRRSKKEKELAEA